MSIVCRDNERTIGRTLDSVRGLAGEIVAVDSGSRDGTLDLLAAAGARVVHSAWLGHVKTKQLALEACTGEWVLHLDSDESLLPDLRASIERVMASGPVGVDGFAVNRRVYYAGHPLRHAWQPEWRLRLVRRAAAEWKGLDPHDVLALKPAASGGGAGRVRRLDGHLRHDSVETFAEFLRKQVGHAETMARSMQAEGRRGSRLRVVTSPVGALVKQLVLKQAWRDGVPGFLAAGSTAAATLIKHLILLERTADGRGAGPRAD